MSGNPENEVINLVSDEEDVFSVILDYGYNAFQPANSNRQTPSQPVRDGFSRDTGDDVVAVCPSCGRELAYDPDESPDDDHTKPATSKTSRNKRDKAEHYFFAVKACGHVYCKSCYENRKPSARNPVHVGFRSDPNGTKNKILCAVDGCESEVGTKTSWVGIFV